MFEKEKQKLIDNWPEDPRERRKQIKKLYETLCFESDAEVLQLNRLGLAGREIQSFAMMLASVNIGKLVEMVKHTKRNRKAPAREYDIVGSWLP